MTSHVLILDTTLKGALVALAETQTGRLVALKADTATHAATSAVGRLCAETLEATATSWDQIAAFGVAHGPGSFTGIKVGLAFALGVQAARADLAIHPVSTLEALGDASSETEAWLLPSNRLQGFLAVKAAGKTSLFIVDVTTAPRLFAEKDRLEVSSEILKDKLIRLLFPWPEAEKAFAGVNLSVKIEDEAGWTQRVARSLAQSIQMRIASGSSPAPLEPRYIRDSAPQEKLRAEGRNG